MPRHGNAPSGTRAGLRLLDNKKVRIATSTGAVMSALVGGMPMRRGSTHGPQSRH